MISPIIKLKLQWTLLPSKLPPTILNESQLKLPSCKDHLHSPLFKFVEEKGLTWLHYIFSCSSKLINVWTSYNLFSLVKLFVEKRDLKAGNWDCLLVVKALNGANISTNNGNLRRGVGPFHQKWLCICHVFVRYLWPVPVNSPPIQQALIFKFMHAITVVHIIFLIHFLTIYAWMSIFHSLQLHLMCMSTCRHENQEHILDIAWFGEKTRVQDFQR